MDRPQESVPVIVLGSYFTALGVVRSLGRHRIPLFWVPQEMDYVRHSRWCRQFPKEVGLPSSPDELNSFLEKLPLDEAVLIPCSDTWAQAIANLDSRLAQRFLTSLPCADSLDTLMNKAKLAAVLMESRIPHPKTYRLPDEDELRRVAPRNLTNWFLKPEDSQTFRIRFGRKAFRVTDLQDALQKYRRIVREGFNVVLQEYVPGPPSQHYFIDGFSDRDHEIRVLFARQRIRMYPPDFGDSSYLTTVPLTEAKSAEKSIRTLLAEVPYRGIFSVEFKVDERDSEFKLIEVNTRAWVYIEFAAQCGVDVTYMTYLDALGQTVPRVDTYPIGRSMSFLPNDLHSALAMIQAGKLGAFEWLKSQIKAFPSIMSLDDPLPDILRYSSCILDGIKGILR